MLEDRVGASPKLQSGAGLQWSASIKTWVKKGTVVNSQKGHRWQRLALVEIQQAKSMLYHVDNEAHMELVNAWHQASLWEEGKLVLLGRFACALPQSRNSSGMMEEHNQLKVLTNFIRSLSNRASVLKKLVCWRLQMQLRGSAANILVPDATANIQQSAGIHVSISHDVVAADGGWTQY